MDSNGNSNLKSPKHDHPVPFMGRGRERFKNWLSRTWMTIRRLRKTILTIILFHLILASLSIWECVNTIRLNCSKKLSGSFGLLALISILRLIWFYGAGKSQSQAAKSIITESRLHDPEAIKKFKVEQKAIYRIWGLWGKAGMVLSFFQFGSSACLTISAAMDLSFYSPTESKNNCSIYGEFWTGVFVVLLCCLSWLLCLAQCICGSDVFAWRSLYSMHDYAWRAHYRELFNRNIREILCCLGRRHYWDSMEDDDVDAVSSLLGDLMAYRAVGASHLEVLAGLALLREPNSRKVFEKKSQIPPIEVLKEASFLHSFAIAAYTGPLLDLGRNPFTFLCVWLFRQGVLAPWARHRRPILEGDNYWRGHATAFLNYLHLSPELLLKGRVKQRSSQAVYFVVVFHALQSIIVCVRGTESPEDLIIDGLGKECALDEADLGCIERSAGKNGEFFPPFGHAGVVYAARELAFQLDNMPMEGKLNQDQNEVPRGYLSQLLHEKFHGYSLKIVGHSMGGAVASLTGIRLSLRFPNLHVYAYGSIPCVDYLTAEASSSIITSIVYNDEFSCRMSVASLMRLRASALSAVSAQADADLPMIHNLTKLLHSIPSNASRQTSFLATAGSNAVTTLANILTNAISTATSVASVVSKKKPFLGKINFSLKDKFLSRHPSDDLANVTAPPQQGMISISVPPSDKRLDVSQTIQDGRGHESLSVSTSTQPKSEIIPVSEGQSESKNERNSYTSSNTPPSPYFSRHEDGYTEADFSSLADYSHIQGRKDYSEWRRGIPENANEEGEDSAPKRRVHMFKHKILGFICFGNFVYSCACNSYHLSQSKSRSLSISIPQTSSTLSQDVNDTIHDDDSDVGNHAVANVDNFSGSIDPDYLDSDQNNSNRRVDAFHPSFSKKCLDCSACLPSFNPLYVQNGTNFPCICGCQFESALKENKKKHPSTLHSHSKHFSRENSSVFTIQMKMDHHENEDEINYQLDSSGSDNFENERGCDDIDANNGCNDERKLQNCDKPPVLFPNTTDKSNSDSVLGNMPSLLSSSLTNAPLVHSLPSHRHPSSDALKTEELEQFMPSAELLSQIEDGGNERKKHSILPDPSYSSEPNHSETVNASQRRNPEFDRDHHSGEILQSSIQTFQSQDYYDKIRREIYDENEDEPEDGNENEDEDEEDALDYELNRYYFNENDEFNSFRLYNEKLKKYSQNLIHPCEVFVPGEVLLIIRDEGDTPGVVGDIDVQNLTSSGSGTDHVMDGKSDGIRREGELHGVGDVKHGDENQLWSFIKSNLRRDSSSGGLRQKPKHRIMVIDRESLKDLIISPSMFLDHLPWRMSSALNEILDSMANGGSLIVNEMGKNHLIDIS